MEKALQQLVHGYQSLNSSAVSELDHTPDPLEFSRAVASNRPLVIRGQGQRDRTVALSRWTNEYLIERLGGKKVAIAVSPDGQAPSLHLRFSPLLTSRCRNADSIVAGKYFVEPASEFKLQSEPAGPFADAHI
jgi:hypothetical protein